MRPSSISPFRQQGCVKRSRSHYSGIRAACPKIANAKGRNDCHDQLPAVRSPGGGDNAHGVLSGFLRLQRLWANAEAEAGGLLRVLLVRGPAVPVETRWEQLPLSRDETYSPFGMMPAPKVYKPGDPLYEFLKGDTRIRLRARRPWRRGKDCSQRRASHQPHVRAVALRAVRDTVCGGDSLGRERAERDRER
jgi:hypothetical protein